MFNQQQTGKGIASTADFVYELVEGKKYKWSGKNLDGFDCSGFVAHVFKQLFPEKSNNFQTVVRGFINSDLFETVGSPRLGDLIVFPKHKNYLNHIGIVIDQFGWLGSQSSTGVAFVLFSNGFWSSRPSSFRRYKYSSPNAITTGIRSKVYGHV